MRHVPQQLASPRVQLVDYGIRGMHLAYDLLDGCDALVLVDAIPNSGAPGTVHVFENDTGPDDANHAHEGLYVLVADGVPTGPGSQRALHDVAPTLLELLGESVPAEMEGQSMLRSAAAGEPESSASRGDSVTDTRTLSR